MAVGRNVPWLVGGSADLTPSTKTRLGFEDAGDYTPQHPGRNLHFGVREHAMGAILNGLSLSKVRPYGSGFLIFSDYAPEGHIATEYLPPYAPELNPVEYIWAYWKQHELPNVCPKDYGELNERARKALRRMYRKPRLITAFWKQSSLCFD